MDGVISDFDKAAKEQGNGKRPDLYVDYGSLDTIHGAKEALMRLDQDFNIYIASTPPWSRPDMWAAKRRWLEEHFPYLKRKLILTHHKDLLKGDILIDDSKWRGQPNFEGEWFWFNKDWENRNWEACLKWIYKK